MDAKYRLLLRLSTNVVARHLDDVGPRGTDLRERPADAAKRLAYLHLGIVREHPVFVTADMPRDEHKSAIPEGRRVPQLRRAFVRQARFAIAHVWKYEAAVDGAVRTTTRPGVVPSPPVVSPAVSL